MVAYDVAWAIVMSLAIRALAPGFSPSGSAPSAPAAPREG
jgi:hypothetical protein